jgi:uncharacterized protein YciI
MPEWLCLLRPERIAMVAEGPTEEEADAVERHFAYLVRLAQSGSVRLAGRTTTEDEHVFGIVVFEAPSEADARAQVDADPAIAEGVMSAEVFPFHVAVERPATPRQPGP